MATYTDDPHGYVLCLSWAAGMWDANEPEYYAAYRLLAKLATPLASKVQ